MARVKEDAKPRRSRRSSRDEWVEGACPCGAVAFEIGYPARWAWHDHTQTSRRAHGAAYATYVGSWLSRFRFTKGEDFVARYEDEKAGRTRTFCKRCGAPLTYQRSHSPKMVNIPRAHFEGRTGREPLYHVGVEELQDWTYLGERLVPLKGFPGVMWTRPKPKRPKVVD